MTSNNGNSTQMVRTTMAIPIDIGGGQVAKINLPPGATLAGPVKVLTLPNQQTIAHVTVMAPPGVVEKYVAQAAADSEAGTAATPAPQIKPDKPASPPPVPKPSVVKSPAPKSPVRESAPSNLFDKLTTKSAPAKVGSTINDSKPVVNKRSKKSSSSSDDLPLSVLSKKSDPRPPPEDIPIKKKTKPSSEAKPGPKEKKPQTGFGAYAEEMRDTVLEENPHYSDKEITRDVRELWEGLDVSTKNNYIRNSDAYKIKKGIKTKPEDLSKKRIPKKSKPKPEPSSPALRIPKSDPRRDAKTPSGYNYPKRNVKRKHFDVSDHEDDEDDEDWKMPAGDPLPPKPVVPSAMPPLKFKKKSRDMSKDPRQERTPRTSVNDDEELPAMLDDDKPTSFAHKINLHRPSDLDLIKESTPPPPLRKIDTVEAPPERKANFKPICLHEGCYEEAKTTDDRGKYWCSNRCCILYSKIIFNAWIGARKANMIE